MRILGTAFLCGTSLLALATPAVAQDAGDAGAEETVEADIIVTAQRREQRLQDVPLAISVVSDETLAASNFTTIADIQFLSPGVNYNSNFGGGFNIRGVGTQSLLMTAEQSVALVVDDIVQALPEVSFSGPSYQAMGDVERIEVLKGPQGTLFGKNSSAGVIHIVTKRPRLGERSLDASFSFGGHNELNNQAYANLPLGDIAALRVGGSIQRRDGFVENRLTGQSIWGYERYSARARLLVEPSPAFSILLTGEYRKAEDDANGAWTLRSCGSGYRRTATGPLLFSPCASLAPFGIVAGPKNLATAIEGRPFTDQTNKSASLRLDYDLGPATLTSITGYRHLRQRINSDVDASPTPINTRNNYLSGGDQFSQEVRLNGSGGIFEYTVGAFYYRGTPFQTALGNGGTLGLIPATSSFYLSNSNIGPGSTSGYAPDVQARVKSWAAFGQIEVSPIEQLTLIFGGRYTDDKVAQTISYYDVPGMCAAASVLATGACHASAIPPGPFSASTAASKFTYKLTGKYDITPDINVFASYATGYKGPMISYPAGQPQLLVRPETSESYEIGLKSMFFDRRVTLNIDAFKVDYRDFQAQQRVQTDPVTSFYTTTNAGSLQTKGIEADLTAQLTSAFSVGARMAYIPTKFTDYAVQCKDQFTNPATSPGQCNYVPPGSPAGTPNQFNASGYPLIYSPKWAYGIDADLNLPVAADYEFSAHASYNWRGKAYGEVADPNTIIPSYGIVNAQVGFGPGDGSWKLAAFARNLFDKHFVAGIFTTPFDSGLPNTNPLSTRGYANIPALDGERTIGLKLEISLGN